MNINVTDVLLSLFCEKNSDGTKNLRLKGNELQQRFGNRLGPTEMVKVSTFLNENPSIVKLNLCYNNIGDEGIEVLSKLYLSNTNNLTHINLMMCDITHIGLKFVANCVKNTESKLQVIRLSCNKLGAESGSSVAAMVRHCTDLKYIDIGDSDQTIFSISQILSEVAYSNVNVIDISRIIPKHNYVRCLPMELAQDLAPILESNRSLVEIHLQKNELDGHDLDLLLRGGLAFNKTLRFLDLGANRIADHGCEILAVWFKTKPPLQALVISGCNIMDKGAQALSYALPYTRIRLLDISKNKITDSGLLDILYSLKKPTMLRIFFLWGNTFGHDVNAVIRRMLQSGVLEQDCIDIKIYEVNEVLYHAYYPTNIYKNLYYCVTVHGCATELKIIKHKILEPDAKPRALLDYTNMKRYPSIPQVKVREDVVENSENMEEEEYSMSEEDDFEDVSMEVTQYITEFD